MKNKIKQFLSEKFGEVRAVKINNVIWFVATDIAKVLGYNLASDMTRNLEDDEKGMQSLHTIKGEQKMTVINESGLYSVVLSITKRNKERYELSRDFKKWITGEVIPTLRETGAYIETEREEEVVEKYFGEFSDDLKLEMMRQLKKKNEELQIKATKHDKFLDTESTFTFEETAKLLATRAQDEHGIVFKVSSKTLPKYLREKGILCKDKSGKSYKNLPTINYEQYFDVVSRNVGENINKVQSRVKATGIDFIYDQLVLDEFHMN